MATRVFSFNRLLISACYCLCILLAACVPAPISSGDISGCQSPTPENNPYYVGLQNDLSNIHDTSIDDNYRQKAFDLLGKITDRWSKYVDIPVDATQTIRIMVTYLHPALMKYLLLNDTFSDNSVVSAGLFTTRLQDSLGGLKERDKMLFMITITAKVYKQQVYNDKATLLTLPIQSMALINSKGMRVLPTYIDAGLSEQIPVANGAVSGIVGYPISVSSQNNCVLFIDPQSTTLTLELQQVTVGGMPPSTQFWSIPYHPLLNQDSPFTLKSMDDPTVAYIIDRNRRISKSSTPPELSSWSVTINNETSRRIYWEEMGRYLWFMLIHD